ncbi:MAG: hypothetical protein ABSE06_04675 [Anaerolineaceae bacterium]
MYLERPGVSRRSLLIGITFGVLVLLFILSFWNEILQSFQFVWGLVTFAVLPTSMIPPSAGNSWSVAVVCFNIVFGFGLVFAGWLFLLSRQAVLPVNGLVDVWRTTWHLFLYSLRLHGPAIFVKDGKALVTREDERRIGPGVVVVDFNSAVVLEEMILPSGLLGGSQGLVQRLLLALRLTDRYESPRARGCGVVFTRPHERIRGVVDLRKQFRMQSDVSAYTREGIEVSTNVFTLFTIGEKPDVLQVTYLDDQREENLRVVVAEKLPDGRLKVKDLQDELDEEDRREIHHYARVAGRLGALGPYQPTPPDSQLPEFDAERVFAAVFSAARNAQDEVVPWYDLPTQVAVEQFREMLSRENYDTLYQQGSSPRLPLLEVKSKLRMRMRDMGILSFRILAHKSQELEIDQVYNPADLLVSPVRVLTGRKVLRERGIKIIASSFGDLMPVSEGVYKQRLDNWRATWERDIAVVHANRDLEAMRVRSRAQAQAQRDLFNAFSKIFQSTENSEEVLTIRVFQALESLAGDPKTRQFLPRETVNIISNLHGWLLPEEGQGKPQ